MQNSTVQPARPGLLSGLGRAFKLGGLFSRGPADPAPQAQRDSDRAPAVTSDRLTLDAVALLNSAHGDAAIAHALAEALRLSTGSALAAVLLPTHNTRSFTLTSFSAEEDTAGLNILRGAVDTSVAALRAIEHGAAIAIGEPLPADALPAWARARKYASGLVAPVTSGDHTLAIVYALSHGTAPASIQQIESAELLLSIAARHFGRPTPPTEPRKNAIPPTVEQPAAAGPGRPAAMTLSAPAIIPVSTTQSRAVVESLVARTDPARQPSTALVGPVPLRQSAPPSLPAVPSSLEGRVPTEAGSRVRGDQLYRSALSEVEALRPPAAPVSAMSTPRPAPAVAAARPSAIPTPIARFLPERLTQRHALTAFGIDLDPARESAEILGTRISLSSTEFSLLYALASAGQNAVTLGHLAQACWDETGAPSANAVEVALSRLKKKLARAPGGEGVIHTVKGRGYRLNAPQLPALNPPEVGDGGPHSPGHAPQAAAAAD